MASEAGERPPDPSRAWPPDAEAVLFLSRDDVRALTRGSAACVEAANLPVHDPGAYVRADIVLRGLLQVARNRLQEAGVLGPMFYLDPEAWPQEFPVLVGHEDGEALYRAAAACRAAGTVAGRGDPRRGELDGTRSALLRLLRTADAQLAGEEET